MIDSIWYDAEAYNGKGTKFSDDVNFEVTEETYGCNNKRECPCDTCPNFNTCLENATECSAMRNWCSKGDYKDADLIRLVRAI
jgi:hypothetical protein